MSETLWGWIVFLIFFGFVLTCLGILFHGLMLVCAWLYRVLVFPHTDAARSFEEFHAWQERMLEDTPYMAPPRGDPTGPDDDGLSPLVEIWRHK